MAKEKTANKKSKNFLISADLPLTSVGWIKRSESTENWWIRSKTRSFIHPT